MCPDNWQKITQKKCIIISIGLCLLIVSYIWHRNEGLQYYTFSCAINGNDRTSDSANNRTNDSVSLSRLDHLQEVKLQRMLYDKPDALTPLRTDVAVLTPWLAPIVWDGTFNIDILNEYFHRKGTHIGITVFAIKKYVMFVKTFIETAEQFFMVGHNVTYYVFTDRPNDIPLVPLKEGRHLEILEVPGYKRWQDITMRRMQVIRDNCRQRFLNEVDYLVCVDVDMTFNDHVGVEILSDVFGALHPGFFGASRPAFTYERRPRSQAGIPVDEGDYYYAGGFFGGTIEEVYKLTNFCHNAMMTDKEHNLEALWHDESYLNKYFLYHKPTKILSPEYIWNSYYGNPAVLKKKRFNSIQKDYSQVRSRRSV